MTENEPILRLWIYSRASNKTEERVREMVDYLLAQPRFAPDKAGEYEPYRRLTPRWAEETVASLAALVNQELDP